MAIKPRMVLRYIHISVGSDHFWGLKFLKFNIIFWSFQKNDYFWGYEAFCLWGGGGGGGGGGFEGRGGGG